MNKKELFGTLLGIITGGLGLGWVIENQIKNNKDLENGENILLIFYTFIGSAFGGTLSWATTRLLYTNNSDYLQNNEYYREFFESQRIENNSNQLVNESTPLLEEHIININNEDNLPILDNLFTNKNLNISV